MVSSTTVACSGVIAKGARRLTTLEDWRRRAAPKGTGHWKNGRSAKENARLWLGAAPDLPSGIAKVLAACAGVGNLRSWSAEPEARVRFDAFGGEPANLDVLVQASDEYGPIVVGVEAKADETFGHTVEKTLLQARKRLMQNPGSKGVERIRQLAAVFGLDLEQRETLDLRYQLLTLTAATLAEARRQFADRAVIIVQEFVTPITNAENRARNARDLEEFLRTVLGHAGGIGPDTIAGPFAGDGLCRLHVAKAQTVL